MTSSGWPSAASSTSRAKRYIGPATRKVRYSATSQVKPPASSSSTSPTSSSAGRSSASLSVKAPTSPA